MRVWELASAREAMAGPVVAKPTSAGVVDRHPQTKNQSRAWSIRISRYS